MLDINPETVCYIISRVRQFQAKEAAVIPEEPFNPSDDRALQVLADHADDLTFQELKTAIDDLEPDQQVVLIALTWVGRGTYDAGEWEDALADAGDNWTSRTAEYLIATPMVADYLTGGLSQLGYSCED